MTQANVVDRPQEPSPPAPENEKLERRLTLLLTVGPFIAVLLAIPLLWHNGISGLDLGLLIGGHIVAATGVTVGFHRHFTHGGFEAPRWVRFVLAVNGSLAIEGGVIAWVAAHRRHHAFADKAGDPHSPHLEETEGVWGVLKGLFHAHVGWLFDPEANRTRAPRYAPDLLKDPDMVRIDKAFPWLVLVSLLTPPLIGLVVTRTLWGAVTAFIWGSLVRAFLVHHVTWSINSICHFYGRRPFESKDYSTNNWALAVISLGESWHNNHHAFPSSARHGLLRGQIDIGAWIIKGLERLGMARNVKIPTAEQMAAKRIA